MSVFFAIKEIFYKVLSVDLENVSLHFSNDDIFTIFLDSGFNDKKLKMCEIFYLFSQFDISCENSN